MSILTHMQFTEGRLEMFRRKPQREVDLTEVTLLDRREVIRRLKISDWTLARLIRTGAFPRPIRIGGSDRWRASQISSWLDDLARRPHLPRPLRGKAARWHAKPVRIRFERTVGKPLPPQIVHVERTIGEAPPPQIVRIRVHKGGTGDY